MFSYKSLMWNITPKNQLQYTLTGHLQGKQVTETLQKKEGGGRMGFKPYICERKQTYE